MSAYHHGNLRDALITNAVALAREQGPPGVVLREVARRAGVSHNAAYRHFSSREDLVAAVSDYAMSELAAAMIARFAPLDGLDQAERARRRLMETGRAYVEFALAEPGLFELAFSTKKVDDPVDSGPYAVLGQVLDEMVTTGAMPKERRPGAEVTCWAAVHGFATLCLKGPTSEASGPERKRLLDHLLVTIERGLH